MSAAPATAPMACAISTPADASPTPPASPSKYIVFDMDGVLLDSEPIYLEVEGALIKKLAGPEANLHEILPKLLGRTSPDSARITVEHFKLDMSVDAFLRAREAALVPAFANCPFLPGADAFVRRMYKAGVRMAVATSSAKVFLDAKRTGKEDVFSLFEGVVCGDDVKNGKPDPEIFVKAAGVLGVEPASCIVFEDAPAGVKGAKAAGMTVVAFPNPEVERKLYVNAGFDLACDGWKSFEPKSVGLPEW